jgi:two-component sensor histidine kinase/ABC-type amino acid transport substrate-binding protein
MRNHIFALIVFIGIGLGSKAQTPVSFTKEEQEWIKAHPKLRFGYDPEWAPYEIYEHGQFKGIINEYLNKIKQKTGIEFIAIENIRKFHQSLEEKLTEKEIDFISDMVITDKRKQNYLMTSPLANEPVVIATRKDDDFIGDLNSLKQKKVAIPFGYYTIELLNRDYPEIKIIQKNSFKDCMLALSTGEVDATVELLGVMSYNINNNGFTNIKIAAPTEYKNTELAMAFDTSDVMLFNITQKVLNSISEREHSQIRQKWISVTYDHKNDNSKLIFYLKVIAAIAFGIALLMYLWNLSLRKYIKRIEESESKLKASLTQISRQNEERKFLLQEIHHRVKNNLQIISSLLKLQAVNNAQKNEIFNLDATIDRIRAIGLIHEKIYQSPDLDKTSLHDYISSLVNTILSNYANKEKIKTKFDIDLINIHIENIVPLAIIVNELVTNTVKHGTKENDKPVIQLSIKTVGSNYILKYTDGGKWTPNASKLNFGETLIEIFSQQLSGTYEIEIKNKTTYIITLPDKIKDEL